MESSDRYKKTRNTFLILSLELFLYALIGYWAINHTELSKMVPLQKLFFYVGVLFLFIHYRLSYFIFINFRKGHLTVNKTSFFILLLIIASLIAQSKFHQIATLWFELSEKAQGFYFRPNEYKYWIGALNYMVFVVTLFAYFLVNIFRSKSKNQSIVEAKINFIVVVAHLFIVLTFLFCDISIFRFDLYIEKVLPKKILYISIFYASCISLYYYKRFIPSYSFFIPFLVIPVVLQSYFISSDIKFGDVFMSFVIAPYYLFVVDLFHGNVNLSYGSSKRIYMKRQLSSHYLLNSMNLIYSKMLSEKDNEAKELMEKFIEQMKYITYDADEMKISLQKEIDFISDYIEIMKGRMISGDNMLLDVKLPNEMPDKEVPPLILLPPVENMFKHGISKIEKSILKLDISIDKGMLIVSTKNTNNTNSNESNYNGKGLKILKDNLNFMYPGKHHLTIENRDDLFCLYLSVKL